MGIRVDKINTLGAADMENLCQATQDAISDGIGFSWVTPPIREMMESYWNGVLLVPERELFGGWLDGTLCASVQLLRPGKNKETSYFSAGIESHFVAPWARGHGLARMLLQAAEREAASSGFTVLRLSVRETQEAALQLYQDNGYVRWGILPYHEFVGGQMVAGHYFYKKLERLSSVE